MDKETIYRELMARYEAQHPQSAAFFARADRLQLRGGSHNLRLFEPFPFYEVECRGARVKDLDGFSYVDFWQGHFANVLGHNPPVVMQALSRLFAGGQGLVTGFPGVHQSELASIILERCHVEKIRFTTSGSLATMYAIMLARAFTGRERVMKVGGGWHGGQPFALKGVSTWEQGLKRLESAGLPPNTDAGIIITRFNDAEDLEGQFEEHGEKVACLILELMVGSGGLIVADKAYVQAAVRLCQEHGALLIIDEVVTGFRFRATGLHVLFDVHPDLCIFGKCIGGGMPVSAVAGREEIMALAAPGAPPGRAVKFDGGTFSAHPACMAAGIAILRHLIEHEEEIYPRVGRLAARVRKEIPEIFRRFGFNVRCTGEATPVMGHSPFVGVHFVVDEDARVLSPDEAWNPEVCDVMLREKIFRLAMLEQGFNIFHGYGSVTAAHTEADIQASLDAVEQIAGQWRG